jgi:hypothetical protein
LFTSLLKLRHAPLHTVWPTAHAVPHDPPTHTRPPEHAVPHDAQFASSVLTKRHVPEQFVEPAGQPVSGALHDPGQYPRICEPLANCALPL